MPIKDSMRIIENFLGSCPYCGGPIELLEHVHCRNADGSPSEDDTYTDVYCRKCQIWWEDGEASPEDFRDGKMPEIEAF